MKTIPIIQIIYYLLSLTPSLVQAREKIIKIQCPAQNALVKKPAHVLYVDTRRL